MVLPLIPIIGWALAAGAAAKGIHGAVKMKEAKEDIEWANRCNERNVEKGKEAYEKTSKELDKLGTKEMQILSSFKEFSELFAHIKNQPKFHNITIDGYKIPKFNLKELEDVSVGANVLAAGLSSAAIGTAAAFAVSGSQQAAMLALGSVATGAAVSSIAPAATATTLSALGVTSFAAAGGSGMALGSLLFGTSTLGIGFIVSGLAFSLAGSRLSKQAEEIKSRMYENEEKINKVCDYLEQLHSTAKSYNSTLKKVYKVYQQNMTLLEEVVSKHTNLYSTKADWSAFSDGEKLIVKNTVSLVQVLYAMCKVKLVLKDEKASDSEDVQDINEVEINEAQTMAKHALNAFAV